MKLVLQAFITCCLVYCNSLLYGINDCFQARTVTAECRRTTALASSVEQRVNYKIALPVHKSLNEQGATQYLADNCQLTSARGLIES